MEENKKAYKEEDGGVPKEADGMREKSRRTEDKEDGDGWALEEPLLCLVF